MAGFADIHAHVIPGIDDGPETLEQSVAMVRAAAAQGTRFQAATPHLHPRFPDVIPAEIADRLQAVRDAAQTDEIELISGGEVSVSWAMDAGDDQLKLVSYGQRGSDILIETPSAGLIGINTVLADVQRKGYRVVLAHPERGIHGDGDFPRLETISAQGVILQVNAESLLATNKTLRRNARRLCSDGLARVIASDGHSGTERRPVTVLAEGIAELEKLVGEERAAWMSQAAPHAVLTGARLPPEPEVAQRRGLFGRR